MAATESNEIYVEDEFMIIWRDAARDCIRAKSKTTNDVLWIYSRAMQSQNNLFDQFQYDIADDSWILHGLNRKDVMAQTVSTKVSIVHDVALQLQQMQKGDNGIFQQIIDPNHIFYNSRTLRWFLFSPYIDAGCYRKKIVCYFTSDPYLIRNNARQLSPNEKSDVYSLATMFYTLLFGHVPFHKCLPAVVLEFKAQKNVMPWTDEMLEKIPPYLREIMTRMMDYSPDARPDMASVILTFSLYFNDPVD